jgi:hypothetical protein
MRIIAYGTCSRRGRGRYRWRTLSSTESVPHWSSTANTHRQEHSARSSTSQCVRAKNRCDITRVCKDVRYTGHSSKRCRTVSRDAVSSQCRVQFQPASSRRRIAKPVRSSPIAPAEEELGDYGFRGAVPKPPLRYASSSARRSSGTATPQFTICVIVRAHPAESFRCCTSIEAEWQVMQ